MILELMSARLALSVSYLQKLADTASHRYKEYSIPKKTDGMRTIHHPARELKLLQRWLLRNVLSELPIHGAATAYREGSSTKLNADMHVSHNYLLRIDFQDFFPSLTSEDILTLLRANQTLLAKGQMTETDIDFITQIVCRFGSLTIGAPTSPSLSNAIMFAFDDTWWRAARDRDVTYTRYADDLYFSTNQPNVLRDMLDGVRQHLMAQRAPALRINDKKTVFSSRKRRRLTAGLVLTSDLRISVGRHKKRMLKSWVKKLKDKELDSLQVASLKGWIAHLRSVEPDFVIALERKYRLDFNAPAAWTT
jgi:RNA-directed DNA polymerase